MKVSDLQKILQEHKEWLLISSEGRRADLQGADLRRADLRRADLQEADLQGADLRRADLRRADLRRADLQGAEGIIRIESQYTYQSYGYYYNNQLRVRLGCFDRTIEEWDSDFWNNEEEFPKDLPEGKNRLMIYNFIKEWLLENNIYKERKEK